MKRKPRGTLAALLRQDLAPSLQLSWAVHLAAASNLDLLVLQRHEDSQDRIDDVPLEESGGGQTRAIVGELLRAMADSGVAKAGAHGDEDAEGGAGDEPGCVRVRLKRVHFTSLPSLRRQVLAELGGSRVEMFTLACRSLAEPADIDMVKEGWLFLRYIPCKVVICQGLEQWRPPSRMLVPAEAGAHGKAALQVGLGLAKAREGSITALHVNPPVGPLSEEVATRRLDRILRGALGPERTYPERRVVVDEQPQRAVRRVWDEGNHDIVVVSSPQSGIGQRAGPRFGKGVPVVTVCAASPLAGKFREIVEDTISRIVPQIEREDRVALVDRIQSSAAWNFDFVALMVLSTVMAAIGLMQNSTAVVIGAMLVAPLMTPLLGLGLSIEQGNALLARISLRSVGLGLCVSLLGGFMVGALTPGFGEPTREMFARGGPGLLDLLVAYAAGLAAAYASCRRSLVAALPGVAIAAALVPPIATSGLALSLGDIRLAIGALLLFGINMVTIVLASMTSLWAVGIRNFKPAEPWVRVAGILVIISVLGLGIYLGIQEQRFELAEEVPAGLAGAIGKSLGADYRLEGLAIAYDELGVHLRVSVTGRTPASEDLATHVRNVASSHYQQPVRVRLLTRIEVDTEPRD